HEGTAIAGQHTGRAFAGRVAGRRAAAGALLVDAPVAVVVELVADLGSAGDLIHAGERAIDPLLVTDLADAPARPAAPAPSRVALVDAAVAVVVAPVANLGGRRDLAVAHDAAARAVAAGRADRALAGVHPARGASTGIALVDVAVAVVVGAVARLDGAVGGDARVLATIVAPPVDVVEARVARAEGAHAAAARAGRVRYAADPPAAAAVERVAHEVDVLVDHAVAVAVAQ